VRLVDDLLDVARITRGHIELQQEVVNLGTLVRNVAEASRVRLEARRHTLTLELPETPLEVEGDPLRLEQIVSNLLENAIKYTEPDGRIAVGVSDAGEEIALSVRDSGIGLRAEDREAIFELFTQVDTSLARSGGGLGIGLTVVRQLVALHGGRIDVRSAGLGLGSEFIVHLPRATAAASQPPISSSPAPVAAPACRVLIVDDNTDAAESLAQLVRSWGHEVATAHNGPEALALSDHFGPEIGFLDIGLPGMTGYELAHHLRTRSRGRAPYLVAMTGYGRPEDRAAALEAGFDIHLVKPATVETLQALLANARGGGVDTQ
jgi:CheY-like chemotaxis protein/two-component sensor histidine kinase